MCACVCVSVCVSACVREELICTCTQKRLIAHIGAVTAMNDGNTAKPTSGLSNLGVYNRQLWRSEVERKSYEVW